MNLNNKTIISPGTNFSEAEIREQIARMSRRSFTKGAIAGAVGLAGFSWIRWFAPTSDGASLPLRKILEFNEALAETFFSHARLAPIFDASLAAEPRPNGRYGLSEAINEADWSFQVHQPERQPQGLNLAAIRALPRLEMTTELKCVEGWSQIVTWAGARLSDFVAAYGLATRSGEKPAFNRRQDWLKYVQLLTPDEKYYVCLDMPSALHPQTLLCYEMNGQPLTPEHGAPLRLIIPVKYGIKNLKRIGAIRFSDNRPADYWAERGYDWYAGL